MANKGQIAILAVFIIGGALVLHARWKTPTVTLPNGFVFRGDDMLSPDLRHVLAIEVEFVCFDDRFVSLGSRVRGQSGLFDAEVGARVRPEDNPEIFQPGGLEYGGGGCNGYYTGLVGPGLLMDGNRAPFLPPCSFVNRTNPGLMDKAWLDRPCADR